MTAPTERAVRPGVRERAAEHLRSPLTRSGYALLLSSVITSVLGLVYWVLAARLYSEGALGRGAALVSAMLLVTSLATAGLKRSLIRFIPTSGPHARGVVLRIYGLGLAISLAGGILLVTGFQGWTDDLPVLDGTVAPAVFFLLGITAWGIFVLQDAVLIGAHRATLVPVTNTIFSVLKIVLLVAGYYLLSRWGVFASWVVPALLVAVAVNVWLFRGGLRGLPEAAEADVPTLRAVARFTSGEYVAALAWQAANYLTPLLVIARAGATANAHYYVAAQIAYTLYLVSSNVTDALVAEGARAADGLARKVRRTGGQTALVLVPGIAITVIAAPLVMAMFGSGYTGEAMTVLRILALSAAPNAVTTMVIAVAHVRQRMSVVVVIQTVMSVLTLGLSWVLVGSHGVVGVAWAWLIAQLVTMVVALAIAAATELPLRAGLRVRLIAAARLLRSQRAKRRARRLLAMQLAALPADVAPKGPVQLLAFQHDLLVVRSGDETGDVILRLAAGRQGRRGIAAHRSQLRALHADAQLRPVHDLIPRVLQSDPGAQWLTETVAVGTSAAALPAGEVRDRAVLAGLVALDRLHGATRRELVVGPELLSLWVHEPVTTVAEVVRDPRAAAGLARLHARLEAELSGQAIEVARLHGDPSLDNLLFSDDGSSATGMVDWESSTIGLPECDLMVLMLARRVAEGAEMGASVLELLDHGWDEEERALLGTAWSVNAHVRPTTAVLLTWLGHVAANLEKTDRYRANRWWLRHNVDAVLIALAGDDDPAHPPLTDVGDAGAGAGAGADRPPEAAGAPHRPALSTTALRWTVGAVTALAWAAVSVEAPIALRVVLVLATTIVLPAAVLGRCLGTPGPLVRGVVGTAGAVSACVLVAEVLLYTDRWSPQLWMVLMGVGTLVLTRFVPPFQPTRPTPPTPADAIVQRARSSKRLG
ncbi:MAG: hypothetical protein JWO77_168 [Ilumatobacteraceae bacterium]|nr:hypothetical protein [Ilumatobacteraceae bacterium]